jgi:hypothetical protein
VTNVIVAQSGGRLQGVGNLLPALQKALPANLQSLAPLIVQGIHDAFALAVGDLFWVSMAAAALALLGLLFLRDLPLRHHEEIPLAG